MFVQCCILPAVILCTHIKRTTPSNISDVSENEVGSGTTGIPVSTKRRADTRYLSARNTQLVSCRRQILPLLSTCVDPSLSFRMALELMIRDSARFSE